MPSTAPPSSATRCAAPAAPTMPPTSSPRRSSPPGGGSTKCRPGEPPARGCTGRGPDRRRPWLLPQRRPHPPAPRPAPLRRSAARHPSHLHTSARQGELMNDETLLSRLAPVTDEQAAAMVSRQALGELAEEIIRTAPQRPTAAQDRRHAQPASGPGRSWRLPLAAGGGLTAAAAVAVALIAAAGPPARAGRSRRTPLLSPARGRPPPPRPPRPRWTRGWSRRTGTAR